MTAPSRVLLAGCLISSSFILVGCGGDSGSGPSALEFLRSASQSDSSGGSAGLLPVDRNFLSVDRFPFGLVFDGGVGKDGIPALTDPSTVTRFSSETSYLQDSDLVLGVVTHGEARAYPHNILWHHEIVNDQIGGYPVIVALCPLTGTGMVFSGRGEGAERLKLGVSGLLFNNNLVMYDRRDGADAQSLYPQMTGSAITGPRVGESLTLLPVVETTWAYWKQLHPETTVVSDRTGVYPTLAYQQYPYGMYRLPTTRPMFQVYPTLDANPIGRIHRSKAMTLGLRFGDRAKAYPFISMPSEAVINDQVAGNNVLVVYYADAQMAIAYDRTLEQDSGSLTLTFDQTSSDDPVYPFLLLDRETGSLWNLKGRAVDGELKGRRLQQLPGHNAFWFAWVTFWQDSEVYY